jgi:hypothetical protein
LRSAVPEFFDEPRNRSTLGTLEARQRDFAGIINM